MSDASVPPPERKADAATEMHRAVSLYRERAFAEAAAICRRLSNETPASFDALRLLGNALLQLREPAEALVAYEQALLQRPDFEELLFNRGNVLQRLGRFEEAVASYDRALGVRPDFAECLNNRGIALQALQRFEEAVESYERALGCRREYPEALNNKGLALLRSSRPFEAAAAFSRALQLRPEYAHAWSNLSMAQRELRQYQEALASADRALLSRRDLAEALVGRGMIWMDCAQYQSASQDFEAALAIEPNSPIALSLLASAALRLGAPEKAVETLERLIAQNPGFSYAQGDLLGARLGCCDWAQVPEQTAAIRSSIAEGRRAIRPFHLLSIVDSTVTQLRAARIFADDTLRAQPRLWRGERYDHPKIRVAYISPDFRDHPISHLMAGVFERHDRSRFETVGISLGPADDSRIRRRVVRAFGEFLDAKDKPDRDVASWVRGREIDIVVDLAGFTDVPRGHLAFRPAPVHVNYLGFPGGLGSPAHDYIVADEFVVPRERRCDYFEKVVYLPDCFQANDSLQRQVAEVPQRGDSGLPECGLVLASFNNCHKIGREMFGIWMRILRAAPDSVLWILSETARGRDNLLREAREQGIPKERLKFAERQPFPVHRARLGLADLFLDTWPFNGGATVSDALWAGVPVITCAGESFASRMAGSLLHTIGLQNLVTYSLEDYERLAVALASNPAELLERRKQLARNRELSPLYDTQRFCRNLEAAFLEMWLGTQRGEGPEHIEIRKPQIS